MYRLGSDTDNAREMVLDDILRVRIDLLVVMAKDYLKGVNPGDRQRKAMEKNADHIETECQFLNGEAFGPPGHMTRQATDQLRRRLMRVTAMIRSAAADSATDRTLQEAMQQDLDVIVDLLDGHHPWSHASMKVA